MLSRNFKKDHPFIVVKRHNEIVFTTPTGEEIASVYVDTMTNDKNEPMENFFLVFKTAEKSPLEHNIATVMCDPKPYSGVV